MKLSNLLLTLCCLMASLVTSNAQNSATFDLAAFGLQSPVKSMIRYYNDGTIEAQFDRQGNLLSCSMDEQICSISRPRQGELLIQSVAGHELHLYVNTASMLLETSELLHDGIFTIRRYLYNAERVLVSYEEVQERGTVTNRMAAGRVLNVFYPSENDSKGNWSERWAGENIVKQEISYFKPRK